MNNKISNSKNALAGILLILGLVIFFIGFATANFDFRRLSSEPPYEKKQFDTDKEVDRIYIEARDTEVFFFPSEDDGIHIEYSENDMDTYKVSIDGKSLNILREVSRQWFDYVFNIQFESQYVKVWLPESFVGALDIDTRDGKLEISGLKLAKLTISAANDKIKLEDVISEGNLLIKNKDGSITLDNVQAGKNLSCENKNAGIKLLDVMGSSIIIKNKDGIIKADNITAAAAIELTTTNDGITFENALYGTEMHINNRDGKIKGSICGNIGDFSIETAVSDGKCNLPETLTSGSKLLKASTKNSNIDITFVENR